MRRAIKPHIEHINSAVSQIINRDLVGFQTAMNIDKMMNTFSFSVIPTRNNISTRTASKICSQLKQEILPMDLILIRFTSREPYFMGIVDNVQESVKHGPSGQLVRAITVTGRDGGKLLELSPLVIEDRIMDRVISETERAQEIWKDTDWKVEELQQIRKFMHGGAKFELFDSLGAMKPVDAIKKLVDHSTNLSFPIQWNSDKLGSGVWSDLFHYDSRWIKQYPHEILNDISTRLDMNLANGLKSLGDPNFYECFVDTRCINGQPKWVIRFRPRPFDRLDDYLPLKPVSESYPDSISDLKIRPIRELIEQYPDLEDFKDLVWDNLKTFIDEKPYHKFDIHSNLDMVTDDADVINVIDSYRAFSLGASYEGVYLPHINPLSVLKYGFRKKKVIPMYTKIPKEVAGYGDRELTEDEKNQVDNFKRYCQFDTQYRYHNWNFLNHAFIRGSVTVPADDTIRVGDKCFIPDATASIGKPGLYFYIGGVIQRWSIANTQATTTCTLFRGQNESMYELSETYNSVDEIRRQIAEHALRENVIPPMQSGE